MKGFKKYTLFAFCLLVGLVLVGVLVLRNSRKYEPQTNIKKGDITIQDSEIEPETEIPKIEDSVDPVVDVLSDHSVDKEVLEYISTANSKFLSTKTLEYYKECLTPEGANITHRKVDFEKQIEARYYQSDDERVRSGAEYFINNGIVQLLHSDRIEILQEVGDVKQLKYRDDIYSELVGILSNSGFNKNEVNILVKNDTLEGTDNPFFQKDIWDKNVLSSKMTNLSIRVKDQKTQNSLIVGGDGRDQIRINIDQDGYLREIKFPFWIGCNVFVTAYNKQYDLVPFIEHTKYNTKISNSEQWNKIIGGFEKWSGHQNYKYKLTENGPASSVVEIVDVDLSKNEIISTSKDDYDSETFISKYIQTGDVINDYDQDNQIISTKSKEFENPFENIKDNFLKFYQGDFSAQWLENVDLKILEEIQDYNNAKVHMICMNLEYKSKNFDAGFYKHKFGGIPNKDCIYFDSESNQILKLEISRNTGSALIYEFEYE